VDGSHYMNAKWTCPNDSKTFCQGWWFGTNVENHERDGD
jgi:hypothetical protein